MFKPSTFRTPLSLAILTALIFQTASFTVPRLAHAEAAVQRALLVSGFSWTGNGLAMAGELLDVVARSGEPVTITADSPEKPSFLCFPVEDAPVPMPPAPPALPAVDPLSYALSEAVSNPSSGKEWVELTISPSTAVATDRDLELWDAAGRIAQVPAGTDVVGGYVVVTLPSAKLNNGGDALSLRTVDGVTLDETTLPSLEKGESWARGLTEWSVTTETTPGTVNRFPVPEPEPEPEETPEAPEEPEETPEENPAPEAPPIGPQLPVFLSEAMSRPLDGSEWVELFVPTEASATLGRELQLWDAVGRIATLGADTPVPASGYVLVALASAKLNNGGDELSVRTADNAVLDSTAIPAVDEGSTWARTDDGQWLETTMPTPGEPNVFPSVAGASDDAEETVSSAGKKPSSNTSANDLDLDLSDMPNETFVNRRVRLVGTVGSIPKLLGSTHAFILLGENGRAAIAYLPKHLNVPPLGATVRVMGTLTSSIKQLELRMKTTDVWVTVATSTPPEPHAVDFLAPGAEDAWSLTQAQGEVLRTNASSFTIDASGVEIDVSIPAAVGYRAARLDKGDTVHVTGLLDPRKSSATILPRTADDIALVERAADSVVTPAGGSTHKTGFPNWVPFGAAVGAVVSTGVAKQAYAFFKKKRLQRLATPKVVPAMN